MPTSWASLLMVLAVALAIAGAGVLPVALVGGLAVAIEVTLDVAAIRSAR